MLTIRHARAREDWNDKNLAQRGFTLVELLIVIIILGVLAAVVILAVGGLNNSGEANACKTDKRAVEAAAAAHYSDTGAFPADAAELETDGYVRDVDFNWTIATDGEATGQTC